jgi:NADH-quinone oxidoreductase subunit B
LITLQKKIDTQSIRKVRWYSKEGTDLIPIPVLGPDVMDPRQYEQIGEYTTKKQAEAQEAAEQAEVQAETQVAPASPQA